MDSVDKYITNSKSNLSNIVKCLENNIEFLNNDLWASLDEFNEIIDNVVKIYYDKYYLYNDDDFDRISNYINFNKKINRKLKTILLAIIDYYESINSEKTLKNKESSILYLNILIYLGLQIYNIDYIKIDEPKKIEKVINNIIDNFAKIRFKKDKDLIVFINNIKKYVEYNNRFNNSINKLNNDKSNNMFIKINNNDYYKVIYENRLKELEHYDSKDINIVNNNMNIKSIFNKISFDICYYTMFKLMNNGKKHILLFPISKDVFNIDNIDFYLKRNKNILNNIKFVIDYNEIEGDYNFINMIREKNIDLYIEIIKSIETNNYNMFMDVKNIICPEDFLSINEKYLEIWKDMNMNFIIKNMESKINENSLLIRK